VPTRRGVRPYVMLALSRDPKTATTRACTWSFPTLAGMLSGERTAVITYDPTSAKGTVVGPAHAQIVEWRFRRTCRKHSCPSRRRSQRNMRCGARSRRRGAESDASKEYAWCCAMMRSVPNTVGNQRT